MLEQTKKAIIYIKTYLSGWTISEDEETIKIWDDTLKYYTLSQLDSILYWARKEKDFRFCPLDVIDKTGREYIECMRKYNKLETKDKETQYSIDHEYTPEQLAIIQEKIKRTIEKIRHHAS